MKADVYVLTRFAHTRYSQSNTKFSYRDFESIYIALLQKIATDLKTKEVYVPSFGIIRRSGKRFRIRFVKRLEKLVMKNLI